MGVRRDLLHRGRELLESAESECVDVAVCKGREEGNVGWAEVVDIHDADARGEAASSAGGRLLPVTRVEMLDGRESE